MGRVAKIAAAAGLASLAGVARAAGPQLALNNCTAGNDNQRFVYNATSGNIQVVAKQGGVTMCFDIEDYNTGDNAVVYTYQCGGSGASSNQQWTVAANYIKSQEPSGLKCLSAEMDQAAQAGSLITTNDCNANDPLQNLHYDATSGLITHVPTGLCVDANAAFPFDFCSKGNHSTWLICNPLADIDARAADIVSRLSLTDKIASLGTSSPALPSINLPPYNWWSEAAHGISHVTYNDRTPFASNTVLPITASQAFNRSLWKATGAQIGREARAFFNVGDAYSTFWAPVINIVRDPRWGRNVESAGEDPFATGQYAINWVTGFQHAPEAPDLLQAAACCKHYVANELENWNGSQRYNFNALVNQQDLVDSYLPPFQDCTEQAKVAGFMCSYNAVNGVPSCANDWLLSTVLRGEWQFDGYVTSDCDADQNVFDQHHYTKTPEEAVGDVLKAGTDVDCGSFVPQYAPSALGNGTITVSDIDTVLKRLFRVRIRLGHFDPPSALSTIGTDQICNPYALELARDGARQGTVLLKNTNGVLPLTASAFKSAAVIGPNYQLSESYAQYYAGNPCNNTYWTAVDAVKNWVPNTVGVPGLSSVSSTDTSLFPAALAAANSADVVILALGMDRSLETEGLDRYEIDLPLGQKWLVGNITAALAGSNKPIIAITMSGGMIDVSTLLANSRVGAILHAGQPSVQILGVGDLIFGKGVPAARMSQTTYPASFVNSVSMFDFQMRPGSSIWAPGSTPGRTYKFYTGTPVLPYGYGLSYTTWTYTPVNPPAKVSLAPVTAGLAAGAARGLTASIPQELREFAVNYWINVTNTGSVDADDVVLGFLVPPGAGTNGVAQQELFGFERVFVPAGQTVTVYLGAQGSAFTQVDTNGVRKVHPGSYTVRFGVRETAAHGMGFAEAKLEAAL